MPFGDGVRAACGILREMHALIRPIQWTLVIVGVCWAAAACRAADGAAASDGEQRAGSGPLQTESRAVAGFDRIEFHSSGTLDVRQGPNESLSITAEAALLPELLSEVVGGTLRLSRRAGARTSATAETRYIVTVKNLSALTLAGSGHVSAIDVHSDALSIQLSGSGTLELVRLDTPALNLKLSGQGSVTASGKAARQDVTVSGAGSYDGRALANADATLTLSGTGRIQVNVEHTLDATVSGAGEIVYQGSPQVTRRISGVGQIRPG